MKKIWIIVAVAILLVTTIFLLKQGSSFEQIDSFEQEMTLYKSSNCGCCGIYSNYFQGKGNSDLNVVNLQDISSIKEKYGIPSQLESCHTTIMGDYFVEGHIPLEAIEKLLTEKPDIKGIAMAGMPNGSPGMPGTKTSDFVIYSVNHDGSYQEVMRL